MKIDYEKAWKQLEQHWKDGKESSLVKTNGKFILDAILSEMEDVKKIALLKIN